MKIGENTIFRQYFADICSFRGQSEEKIVLFGRIFPIFRLPDSHHADAVVPQRGGTTAPFVTAVCAL